MADKENYQVAIDILRCHLGMTADEAREELGLTSAKSISKSVVETQEVLVGIKDE